MITLLGYFLGLSLLIFAGAYWRTRAQKLHLVTLRDINSGAYIVRELYAWNDHDATQKAHYLAQDEGWIPATVSVKALV